jgi:hypothetical protein
MTRRFLLVSALLASMRVLAAPAEPFTLPFDPQLDGPVRYERVRPDAVMPSADAPTSGFDFCMRDPNNGTVLRFNSETGAYIVCGSNGFFEQGTGDITTANGATTLSHFFESPALNKLESVRATANPTTGQGTASINSSTDAGTSALLTITDPHMGSSDCSACSPESTINEGAINDYPDPTATFGFANSVTDVSVLQQFSFNDDFRGTITRLVAAVARQGSGPLAFQLEVRGDDNGVPGDLIYRGPSRHYSTYPALPTIGIVDENVRFRPGARLWAGIRWDPATDRVVVPHGTNADSPLEKVFFCEPGQACRSVTQIPQLAQLRSLPVSLDFRYGDLESGGYVPYDFSPSDTLSEKCDGGYYRIDKTPYGLVQLYAEGGMTTSHSLVSYADAFARITPLPDHVGAGLDGVAETRYAGARYSAFSFTSGNRLSFCTRRFDETDYGCHVVPNFQADACQYTRIVGVTAGFELSCADQVHDWIDRFLIARNASGWTTQTLNPLTASPSIGSPVYGFNWYAASSWKLGVTYEYKTTSGEIQAQVANGNVFTGPYTIDHDLAPAGFNPALATGMALECSRLGRCVGGRYDAATQNNVADMIDFRESPPEIKSWLLGPAPPGFGFGRAINLNEREGTALYAGYGRSPNASNQFRLQLDFIDLDRYTKSTVARDYGAGTANYPLSLSRENGDWALSHAHGVDLYDSLSAGCRPDRIRGRSAGPGDQTRIPCRDIPLVNRF